MEFPEPGAEGFPVRCGGIGPSRGPQRCQRGAVPIQVAVESGDHLCRGIRRRREGLGAGQLLGVTAQGAEQQGQTEPHREDSGAHGRTVGRWAIQSREGLGTLKLESSASSRLDFDSLPNPLRVYRVVEVPGGREPGAW